MTEESFEQLASRISAPEDHHGEYIIASLECAFAIEEDFDIAADNTEMIEAHLREFATEVLRIGRVG